MNKTNPTLKLAILGSTRGTDMQAIVEAINKGELNTTIKVVISNKKDAFILERARNNNLSAVFVNPNSADENIKLSREEFDSEVIKILEQHDVDLILLIGYMRILSAPFVQKYKNRIMNVHPSLLPAFAGGMDLNVHEEVLKAGVKVTGCTVHYVDETVDGGKIITQKWCPVEPNDTVETLKEKVQKLEGSAFIEAIKEFEELNKKIVQVNRVLISVSNKQGVIEFAHNLNQQGIEIVSTGGTARSLAEANIPVTEISNFTGFPEMMNGRLKTLHPLVHGGILGLRDEHEHEAREHNIKWIDLVICNLYPFAETIKKEDATEQEIVENIDIGGPTMIRSAAKNINWVGIIVDPNDYTRLLEEIKENKGLTLETRKKLSAKAFAHTAKYDAVIADYFCTEKFPETLTMTFNKYYDLRYGENPHQTACVYKDNATNDKENTILNAKILQGKKLSYNNINDADGALATLREFYEPACVVVKHANPCGVATGQNITEIFKLAYNADALSSFGGIIALNRTCNREIAEEIIEVFAEIVIAPDYDLDALEVLSKKKKMRVLEIGKINPLSDKQEKRYVDGGLLIQDLDTQNITTDDLKIVTEKRPEDSEIKDMLFAWKVLKHAKSNGILIAKNNTTIGLGAGQVSRVDAVNLAIKKAADKINGAVLASDAFFPFRDSIDKIATTGIKAIIQPGGSIKDQEVIDACNEYGIGMVFTGTRCFKH